ncbi:MAG: MGDG synthase family glycosyltransferase [Gaiellaceae bacterium]
MPPRVLILTASIGEGHDRPAHALAEQLRQEEAGVEVLVEDGLAPMGRLLRTINESGPRLIYYRARWLFDIEYALFSRFAPTRRMGQLLLGPVGGPGLGRLLRSRDPDVVVSTYPVTTEVLAWLRRRGELAVPAVSAVTDLAGLRYWAAPGIDLHLVIHPESESEVRGIAGSETEVRCVRGLSDVSFERPREPRDARRALALPARGKVVLVSGGGWGVGDLEQAIGVALRLEDVRAVVCLCGRNEELRGSLVREYAPESRLRVEGFTDQMSEWMAAGDALVHSTAGLTVQEALVRGCPVISYGWGRGHIRLSNRAYRRFGLADVVGSAGELEQALREALARPRTPDLGFSRRESAASLVLACARRHESARVG